MDKTAGTANQNRTTYIKGLMRKEVERFRDVRRAIWYMHAAKQFGGDTDLHSLFWKANYHEEAALAFEDAGLLRLGGRQRKKAAVAFEGVAGKLRDPLTMVGGEFKNHILMRRADLLRTGKGNVRSIRDEHGIVLPL